MTRTPEAVDFDKRLGLTTRRARRRTAFPGKPSLSILALLSGSSTSLRAVRTASPPTSLFDTQACSEGPPLSCLTRQPAEKRKPKPSADSLAEPGRPPGF
jgi:hypothetical protein